jgi:ATP adenylyltransferase
MPDILWAPWRLKYIERPTTGTKLGSDFFLELPVQNDDRANLILYRGTFAFVIMNAFPYTNGHLLVAPYRQVAEIEEMTDPELLEVNQLLAMSAKWLKATLKPDGFNIGVNLGSAGGAGVPQHIHWHILPRWSGDTNFMTTVGDIRVIPQSLEDCFDKIVRVIRGDATT